MFINFTLLSAVCDAVKKVLEMAIIHMQTKLNKTLNNSER